MNNAKLDIIYTKLKILSKVEPGEKIIIKDHTIEVVDFSTYNLARVRKWYWDETRVSIRQKLKEFYRDIEDLVNNLTNNPPRFLDMDELKMTLSRLLKDLCKSSTGIKNLVLTYNEDKTTRSELETVLERINNILLKIQKKIETKIDGIQLDIKSDNGLLYKEEFVMNKNENIDYDQGTKSEDLVESDSSDSTLEIISKRSRDGNNTFDILDTLDDSDRKNNKSNNKNQNNKNQNSKNQQQTSKNQNKNQQNNKNKRK